jgi:glutamine amidotransferase
MSNKRVVIVDYGMGNTGSLVKMFRRIGCDVVVSHQKTDLLRASHLVLPGVGAFDKAVQRISAVSGLRELIAARVTEQSVPLLGVCLGMQLLLESSDEGPGAGFGWIKGHVCRFENSTEFRIPHMGWNTVNVRRTTPLLDGVSSTARFYFVHSFFVEVEDAVDVIATTSHGVEFASVIGRDNVMGVQFHPEKSHSFGMNVLKNFVGLSTC